MSRVIADGLSKRATATTQEAEDAVEGKYPDAVGVHAAFNQYGLGILTDNLVSVDFNTLPESSYVNGVSGTAPIMTGTNSTNSPPGEKNCWVRHYFYNDGTTNSCNQHATAVTTGKQFYRVRSGGTSGTWTPWHEIYTQNSILGTVSQSAGVPTGAIIERGSNANGEWTKFADGTMICTLTAVSGTFAPGDNFNFTIPYPVTFVGTPQSALFVRSGATGGLFCSTANGQTSVNAGVYNVTSASVTKDIGGFTFGYWY